MYDNLDFQHGVQAFLPAMPAASLAALRKAFRAFGPDNQTVVIFETLMDSVAVPHGEHRKHLRHGLARSEERPRRGRSPPNTLGPGGRFWFHYVTDLGNAGPDEGKGGEVSLPAAGL